MTKHTPGPWAVGPVDDTVVTHVGHDGTRYEIATIDGDYNQPETWPIMEANARLIAAAPDLIDVLEMTQMLVAEAAETGFRWEVGDWTNRLFENQAVISSVLSKARGGRQ